MPDSKENCFNWLLFCQNSRERDATLRNLLDESEGSGFVVKPWNRVPVFESVLQTVQVLPCVLPHLIKPAEKQWIFLSPESSQ